MSTIIAAWAVLSLISFVLMLFVQSWTVAAIAVTVIAIGVLMIGAGDVFPAKGDRATAAKRLSRRG